MIESGKTKLIKSRKVLYYYNTNIRKNDDNVTLEDKIREEQKKLTNNVLKRSLVLRQI